MLPILLPLIPKHRLYLEIFCGSATVFWNKQPSTQEVVNDKDGRLINTLCAVKDNPAHLKKWLDLPSSRELYLRFQEEIETETDPVKRAAMYLYLINNAWSGISKEGTPYVPKLRNHLPLKIDQIDWFCKRLRNVCIENLDFVEAIKKYDSPDTFVLADAPYRIVSDNLYKHSFTEEDHIRLAKSLAAMKGKFLLTYNKDPFIGLLYRKFPHFICETAKTMDRAHNNTKEKHLIIANYDIVQGNFIHFGGTYFVL